VELFEYKCAVLIKSALLPFAWLLFTLTSSVKMSQDLKTIVLWGQWNGGMDILVHLFPGFNGCYKFHEPMSMCCQYSKVLNLFLEKFPRVTASFISMLWSCEERKKNNGRESM